MSTRTRLLIGVALLVLALPLLMVACTPPPQPPAPGNGSVTETPTPQPAETTVVRVYLVRGEHVGVAGREVTETADVPAREAIEALLAGPTADETEWGLSSEIPQGTLVNDVSISRGLATVDLSEEFRSGGGSLSMSLRAAQVVFTLTQFDGVERVEFRIDGEAIEALGGEGVMVGPYVTRADFEDQAPAILIESPYPGEEVSSPLTVEGSSNTFEATHQLNVTDPNGLIVYDDFVTATSGSGERGTWSETVEFEVDRDGLGSVIVFVFSAEDGSQRDIVEVPVRMTAK